MPSTTPPLNLSSGWSHAYDNEGTIYYFNEQTGESSWDPPVSKRSTSLPSEPTDSIISPPAAPFRPSGSDDLDFGFMQLDPQAMKKLSLDQLDREARHQGFVQMKMVSEDNGKLSSWKMYYGVLVHGYLLLYKEAHVKNRKKMATLPPVGSFDLGPCQIQPAAKQDTKRKHSLLITLPPPKKITLYIQAANDKDYAIWTDAIMRDLIVRNEDQTTRDSEISQLLCALALDDHQMKVNKKMQSDTGAHPPNVSNTNKKKGAWLRNKSKADHPAIPPPLQSTQKAALDDDVFGGYLPSNFPAVVQQCIDQVEARGLDVVGIYRLSGPASSIQKYRTAYNKRDPVDLGREPDINVCTGLLKLYLRELKEPLMTFDYYDYFMEAARIDDYDDRMYQIKSILHVLPKPNVKVLEYLMHHLNRVSLQSDVNKMEPSNLALIFSVGLLRLPGHDMASIMHADLQSKIVEAIIQQVDWFFELDDEDGVDGS
ncbi:RhoGAP-domain-containing protein [Hesseltinella vesiculosa]|uniref:RhoGAP-domain-containing protein n=1 Tax=Hesseltinella vesiculosa TaxID=101127 RepID=A0A1X2G736_9FUNG|nr:RhoGAP-domain-containing protein [Hesseltinella vesiculosa]